MLKSYPRGAEWRKWDLHIHTPSSYDVKYAGDDFNEELVKVLQSENISAIALSDHHIIDKDRYSSLRKIIDAKGLDIVIFPAVELRIDKGDGRIHIVAIFSENTDVNTLANDLEALKRNSDSAKSCGDDEKIFFIFEKVKKWIKDRNGLITIHAGGKAKGVDQEYAKALDSADAIKEDIASQIDVFEVSSKKDEADYKVIVWPALKELKIENKPVVICSDNHKLKDVEGANAIGKRFTWIKADLTFEGLKQIINEPRKRVFIGDEPESLTLRKRNSTQIMTEVSIRKSAASSLTGEVWFDNITVPLNSELVAIIGNKGNGKSALSDILGLLGNSHVPTDYFSFLQETKFKKGRKAANFESELKWGNDPNTAWKNLDEKNDRGSIEKVKYIPQLYLERICSEVALDDEAEESDFHKELEQAIFSHIPKPERLDCSSLRELISKKTGQIKDVISHLIAKLWDLNKLIIAIEDKLNPEYKSILLSKYEAKRKELEAIDARIPEKKADPALGNQFTPEIQAIAKSLEGKQKELEKINEDIASTDARLMSSTVKDAKLEEIVAKIENFSSHVAEFRSELNKLLAEFALTSDDVFQFPTRNLAPVVKLREQELAAKAAAANALDPKSPGSYVARKNILLSEIEDLKTRLSTPQKEYQTYLSEYKKWEDDRKGVTGEGPGHIGSLDTIKYFQEQLTAWERLPDEYKKLKEERLRIVESIFTEKDNLCSCLRGYCKYAQDSLAEYDIPKENKNVEFHVEIKEKRFIADFLEHINQRKAGSFKGDQGRQNLVKLVKESDFTTVSGLTKFIQELEKMLMPDGNGKHISVRAQLIESQKIEDLYKHIYSLSYLSPDYSIRFDGKPLESLSTGERGNLLLLFFLLIAKDQRPLIIDQPEDNLDNETIFKTLVPCIDAAKRHRQIVMVTHNPNLAVACDADQIIYSKIEKDRKMTVAYEAGSIEAPIINGHIVDVLEGTRPAFDARDDKYQQ